MKGGGGRGSGVRTGERGVWKAGGRRKGERGADGETGDWRGGTGGERRARKRRARRKAGKKRAPARPSRRRVPRLGDPGAEGLLDRPAQGPDAVQRGRAAARLLGDSRLHDRLVQRRLHDPRHRPQPEPRCAGAGTGAGAGAGVGSRGASPLPGSPASAAGGAGALGRCAVRTPAGGPPAKGVSVLSPSAQPAHAQRHRVLRLRGDPPGGLRPEEVPAGPVPPGPKRLLPGQRRNERW